MTTEAARCPWNGDHMPATDDDFNVGVTNQDELVRLIERPLADDVRSYAQASGDF